MYIALRIRVKEEEEVEEVCGPLWTWYSQRWEFLRLKTMTDISRVFEQLNWYY